MGFYGTGTENHGKTDISTGIVWMGMEKVRISTGTIWMGMKNRDVFGYCLGGTTGIIFSWE